MFSPQLNCVVDRVAGCWSLVTTSHRVA